MGMYIQCCNSSASISNFTKYIVVLKVQIALAKFQTGAMRDRKNISIQSSVYFLMSLCIYSCYIVLDTYTVDPRYLDLGYLE